MEMVWIESERCWGKVLQRNTSYCIVKYYKDGMNYEEVIEVEDLVDLNDMGIDYEEEC
jgi:hypothetical protein